MVYWFVTASVTGIAALAGIVCRRRQVALARERANRIAAENTLRLTHARQRALLDCIDNFAWIKDREHRFLAVNQKFHEVFGVAPEALIGKDDRDISSPELAAHFRAEDLAVLESGQPRQSEEQIPGKDGLVWAEIIKVPVFSDDGEIIGTAGIARDISLRRHYAEQAEFFANKDPLTGLHNRRYLEENFENFAASHPTFVAVTMDLDNFKTINDTEGHTIGDELLRELGLRLSALTGPDDLVVRLGGDEFLIFKSMPTSDVTVIDMLAQEIEQTVVNPYRIAGNIYEISTSMGVASYPEHGKDRLTLIRHVDIAMHVAKNSGRNRYCWFHAALAENAAHRRRIERRLREALETNAFELHYQPVFDTRTSELIGAEALVRLRDAEGAPIPPSAFIPVAEAAGLIEPLGDWVLRTGLAQLAQWRSAGHTELHLAINISGIQFASPGFATKLEHALAEARIPGRVLELELTEGVLMADVESNFAMLSQIRELGVQLVVDDFGTGYSCLAYLKRLPIHRLKIDRSFVDGLPGDAGDIALTHTILQLAHTFQLEVTAEGVETDQQLTLLTELGCEAVQGYLLGRPCDARGFERLLEPALID